MVRKIIGIILIVLASINILFGIMASCVLILPGIASDLIMENSYDATTNGVVIEAHKELYEQNNSYTIVYYEVDGESYTYETNKYCIDYPVGTEVIVEYSADKPEDATVSEIEEATTAGVDFLSTGVGIFCLILCGGIGIIMLAGGIALLIWAKKRPDLSKK